MNPIYDLSIEAQDNLINMLLNYDYILHEHHDDDLCEWDEWLLEHDLYTEEELEIICDGGMNITDIYDLPQYEEAKIDHLHRYIGSLITRYGLSVDQIQLTIMHNKLGV